MNCTDIRPLLSSYIDGEATPEERVRVERHLLRCQDCHQALAEYRAIGSDISALAMPVPPASLRRDVWKAIEARESSRRVFGNPVGSARKTQTVLLPRVQGRSGAASIFTSLGNGWAKALPAALLVGGLLLVMSVLMLRGTIATEAAELVEREPLSDYSKSVHVKFNEQVIAEDAEKYTSVYRFEGAMFVTETVIAKYEYTGNTSGELELKPQTSWLPGATYKVDVDCRKIRTGVAGEVMQNEPLTFTFSAAAFTPTPTNTSTSTPTPTNTPVPVPPSSTPEPTAIAQASPPIAKTPSLPTRTQTKTIASVATITTVVAAATPSVPKGSATVPAKPTNTVVAITPTITPSISVPTKAVPPTLTPETTTTATATVTATVRPPQTATVAPTASTSTVTATSIRKSTPTVTPTITPRVSVTATPPCSIMPVRGFGQVWRTDSSVRERVGCPARPEDAVTPTAYQRFQGGFMFWRGDTRTIYVFKGGATDTYGTWWQFPDTWQEGDPLPSKTPPVKLYAPVRGFGKVWHNNESVQLDLGWALEPESNTGAVWQQYERGNALWTADRTIRFMYSDGLYVRFDDIFVPGPGE